MAFSTERTESASELLGQLRRVVADAPDDRFDMDEWGTSLTCGTTRCAAGWAFLDRWFRKHTWIQSLFVLKSKGRIIPRHDFVVMIDHLAGLLGITPGEARSLFGPDNQSKADVLAEIDRLIRGRGDQKEAAVMTRVVSVRGRSRADMEKDRDFVYVGRPCRGWVGSVYGNPFRGYRADLGREITPAEAVALFERWLLTGEPGGPFHLKAQARRREEILRRLPSLRGKTLGCWCCDWDGTGEPPSPCHAVSLARLADGTGSVRLDRDGESRPADPGRDGRGG